MVAIYDYDPQEISPNVDSEVELSFNTGDIIYVIGEVDEDGFYMGELKGTKGLVPSNFLREVPLEEDEKWSIASRPKGQGRSYLGQADCQWNGHHEKTSSTLKIQLTQQCMEDELPRNFIMYPALKMRGLQPPQNTQHLPHYGKNGISKETQPFEDHIYPLEDKEWPIHKHFQDPPQLSNLGNRPTYLHLQTGVRNYSDDRRRSAPNIQIQVDPLQKDSRKGIFSSFKDMFKGPKRN